jgi:type I restriction-modification system DNA methylase subunit
MTAPERIRQRLEAFGQSQDPALMTHLFGEELGWGQPRGLSPRDLSLGAPISCKAMVVPVAQMSGLPVYCVKWPQEKLPGVTARRAVQKALASVSTEHLVCYVTQDGSQLAFTWTRRRGDGKIELRTLPYEVGSAARTTIEQVAKLAFTFEELSQGEPPITQVTDKLDAAFSVEAVTSAFFADYQRAFENLQQRLLTAISPQQPSPEVRRWAHDYALQLLNRLMFLYFIQRKRWLGGNSRFLRHFWESYKRSRQPPDSFFSRWLGVLFFEAFNKRFPGGYRDLPEDIRQALQLAPYLNGGLFRENRLDQAYVVNLPDAFFEQIFDHFNGSTPGFLERYNFTIAESTPFDVEVAVDPEMIGKVYESLVNITSEGLTEGDLRGMAGIFYTPRAEIDLMCRLALVDALSNRLGGEFRTLLYDVVFATDPDEKTRADAALTAHNLWSRFSDALRSLTICDPACGSGSFLVGMLLVLDDLQARANEQLGIEETPYERRRRIIGNQLYGVDVMDWAVHVAELRLWLQLVVETELKPGELQLRPLLPNLSFKIRPGDSLVQEIAGVNLGLHRQQLEIPASLKGKITQLKGKKLRFYQGEETITEAALKQEELQLFREILQDKIHALHNEIATLNRQIARLGFQTGLPGMEGKLNSRTPAAGETGLRNQLEAKQASLKRFQQALQALRSVQDVPFVWDIAFVEIFEGDCGGFDIVIGNPPYVRQEKIAPPQLDPATFGGEHSEVWKKQKKDYKEKLQRSVATAWPRFFQYRPGTYAFRKPDGKSGLYIYFYLHGLSLLNRKGSFCFITSNSWLDVGYGADLQEFLLKHSHVKLILDNEVKRSFVQADVNTVIVLLAPPDDRRERGLDQIARFVMFKKPFEEVARAEVFKAIEAVTDRHSNEAFRVTARLQRELLEEGLETDADDVRAAPRGCPPTPGGCEQLGKAQGSAPMGKSRAPLIKTARYIGNKWGGKYMRAPEIFFTILEKGKGKLVRLGDIAEVRFGIKTGANEFFYLEPTGKPAPAGYLHVRNGAGWEGEIEEEFLKPVIKSPRECRSILIKPEDLRYKIFMCHRDKSELEGTAALEYIHWGETQGYHERPSCRGRQRWWEARLEVGNGVFVKEANDSSGVFFNPTGLPVDCRLYVAHLSFEQLVYLNSAIACLLFEIFNRAGLGEGARSLMVSDYNKVPCLFTEGESSAFGKTLNSICHKQPRKLLDPFDPEWHALDEVVFDVLGLAPGEREAVYEAVVNLVRARLEKARSVKQK